MMLKKKFLCLFLAVFMLASLLVSCSSNDTDVSDEVGTRQHIIERNVRTHGLEENQTARKQNNHNTIAKHHTKHSRNLFTNIFHNIHLHSQNGQPSH